ncbi:CoA ester lyase [Nocardioides carbamazepini]|uniref:HpcH/HpaI aldolase/citrate lyase family protein n=1 Tax=Nocardioides carbamazepini TaxID=2854259 RepID=UPI00214A244F|nr:CoA ester lyase [Nocardioides carbamazepini]MCR1785576.1 CoA ester lyase [Nocardioides carbamazepini]
MSTSGGSVDLASAVTLLFVPGNQPQRFPKAASAGADVVVCDLEDAVPTDAKQAARSAVINWLAEGHSAAVRVNAPGTASHLADLAALAAVGADLGGVLVPMAETPESLATVAEALPGIPVMALVETARGIRAAAELAAVEGVVRLGIGHLDLAADLDADPDGPLIAHCRHELVLAARTAGSAPPVDGVTASVRGEELVAADASAARRSGFGGKLCIHPAQIHPVAAAFAPSAQETDWARRVLTAAAGGVSVVDGAMVDAPVLARARSILTRAEHT